MSNQEKLQKAMEYAMAHRPKAGGFPFLAECLRRAGAKRKLWALPSTQSIFVMDGGAVVSQGTPLLTGIGDVPAFDEAALIRALRTDQAGESTFPEFLLASWQAGVISYDVDFLARTVTYYGAQGESYQEEYPEVEIGAPPV